MLVTRNQDLRKERGKIPAWIIGEKLGVHENTVHRLFRSELSKEKKAEILAAIAEIKQEIKQAEEI